MEQSYTKRQFKSGVPVRSIDPRLKALRNFCSNPIIQAQILSYKANIKSKAKKNPNQFLPCFSPMLLNLFKALNALEVVFKNKEKGFLDLNLQHLSTAQKGYLSELCVVNFFLERSYAWKLYRSKKYFSEVDLLFFDKVSYHLIEVKSYSDHSFSVGLISNRQKNRLKKSFLALHRDFFPLRAHLISVDLSKKQMYIFFDFL